MYLTADFRQAIISWKRDKEILSIVYIKHMETPAPLHAIVVEQL